MATSQVPGAGDSVTLGVAGRTSSPCIVDSPVTVADVTLTTAYTSALVLHQPLTISSGLFGAGLQMLSTGATICGYLPGGQAQINHGIINLVGISGFQWNAGKLANVTINASYTNSSDYATATVSTDFYKEMTGGVIFDIRGRMRWEEGDVRVKDYQGSSVIAVRAGGRFVIEASAVWGHADTDWGGAEYFVVQNSGQVSVRAGAQPHIHGSYVTEGYTEIEGGAVFDVAGGRFHQTGGTTHLIDGGTARVVDGVDGILHLYTGSLIDTGKVDGNLEVGMPGSGLWTSGGASVVPGYKSGGYTLDPAANYTPGTLNVTGEYTQYGNGVLAIYVTAGGGFGKLAVAETATLGGWLTLNPSKDYKPPAGTQINFLTFDSKAGDFGLKNSSWWGSWLGNPGDTKGTYWKLDHGANSYFLLALLDTSSGPPPGGGGGGGSGGGGS